MDFTAVLKEYTDQAQRALAKYLPEAEAAAYPQTLLASMRYSVVNGGKRLRPVLMLAGYTLCGGEDPSTIEPFMAALEMIHSYSLVHDDLPEMDNDTLRRGKPTTHVAYGHAMAVLAGDGLLNYAYETMLHACLCVDGRAQKDTLRAAAFMAECAGVYGMVGGQSLDVLAEKKDLALDENALLYVYENKTAKLLMAAMGCGALLAQNEAAFAPLCEAACKLGIAFQLQDDLLDLHSTAQELGKSVGIDARNHKKTYVAFLGEKKAMEENERLCNEADELILSIARSSKAADAAGEFLHALIKQLIQRKN